MWKNTTRLFLSFLGGTAVPEQSSELPSRSETGVLQFYKPGERMAFRLALLIYSPSIFPRACHDARDERGLQNIRRKIMAQLKRNPFRLIRSRREATSEVHVAPKVVATPASKSVAKPRMRLDENGNWVGVTLADRNLISVLAQKAGMVVQISPRATEKAPVVPMNARDVAVAKKSAHAKMKVAPDDACTCALDLLKEKGISVALAFLREEFWQVWQIPGLGEALDKARADKAAAEQASREAARVREVEALRRQEETLRFRKKYLLGGEFDSKAAVCAPRTESGHRTNDPEAQRKLRDEMRGTTGGGGKNNRSQKKGSEKNKGGKKGKKDGDGNKWR